MIMITAQERDRLSKLLGMLGSEFDGERATAAAMISKMAKAKKITIPDLCLAPVSSPSYSGTHHTSYSNASKDWDTKSKTQSKQKEEKKDDHSEFIKSARYIYENYMYEINEWEQGFIKNIKDKKLAWTLTDKQRTILERIIKKVTEAVDDGAVSRTFVDEDDDTDVPF